MPKGVSTECLNKLNGWESNGKCTSANACGMLYIRESKLCFTQSISNISTSPGIIFVRLCWYSPTTSDKKMDAVGIVKRTLCRRYIKVYFQFSVEVI